MRELIIHIGLHKTATTWIQHAMHQLSSELESRSVSYPSLDGKFAHHGLCREVVEQNSTSLQGRLTEHIEQSDFQRFIISSENFDRYQEVEIERLHDYVKTMAVKTTVVFFIRNQIDRYESSLLGTRRYRRYFQSDEERLRTCANNTSWKYMTFLRLWQSTFGVDQVRVGIYENETDILDGFLTLCGVQPQELGAKLDVSRMRRNESVDPRFVTTVRALCAAALRQGKTQEEFIAESLPLLRECADSIAQTKESKPRLSLTSLDQRAKIRDLFAEENREFTSVYRPLPSEYFQVDREAVPIESFDEAYASELWLMSLKRQAAEAE